jgi:uncharacterized membrane protein YphA (DoxX/SURF4 family)
MKDRSSGIAQPIGAASIGIEQRHSNEIVGKNTAARGRGTSIAAVAWGRIEDNLDKFLHRFAIVAPTALRMSLALIFLWFGLLKVGGESPVAGLVAATLPWANPSVVVHTLGVVEVGLAVGLLIGRAQRLVLLALAIHLSGTFLTFVMAPGMTMRHGDPLLLTADGEFVLKNLVLISAALFLACHRYAQGNRSRPGLEAEAT